MASSSHNPAILLKRLLSLSEPTPLVLCVDAISQTSSYLIEEIIYNINANVSNKENVIVYVSFETINKPIFATHFIDGLGLNIQELISKLKTFIPAPSEVQTKDKYIVMFDSLNYLPNDKLTQFISSIASPNLSVIGTFHKDMSEVPAKDLSLHYPSSLELLKFMATTIFEVNLLPNISVEDEEFHNELSKYSIIRGANNKIFLLSVINRRKSGRSISYDFQVDHDSHIYEVTKNIDDNNGLTNETPEMLQGLTTFNLSTSAKQKKAKDEVELPFLEAQSFNTGGAIVYEFEKDDDFDEDDPFEDPF
ncbi:hypothetical protein TPHA_0L02140 [Tetrapisispora phaffii CBS 4417]|uniref:Elongator complex protein 5 n=1 Tax=Tetrapisispora phaffii (strain ATCC 24235 / CBS 4417 / NBRC 1672 / NRRL Y-8282 / UCD 70-5) TaxID=1071381 RepID=G8C087_TETPH|nr:hypothetical protein TPHA_0L02140 [Tetrapisispora phaffii CBS 4417]CCE65565.1 hypothetical protein TPHA_0L02140 [Tetrapisispora phaffii CBS 4417]